MRTLCRSLSLALLTIALLFSTSTEPLTAQASPSYGASDLGAFLIPNAIATGGFPILAGSRQTPPATESRGVIGAVGFFRALGTLGGPNSVARATNGSLTAGESQTASGVYHAFVADFSGQMTDIGTLGGGYSYAYGVNDWNVVVGASEVTAGGGPRKAFIYRNGVMSPLAGATFDGVESFAFDINNSDQVVGWADLPGAPGSARAFLYLNGSTTNLGTLGGRSRAFAINDAGVVVGNSALSGFAPIHAFRWESGVMRDLGTLGGANSHAAAINDDGVIAGWAENAQGRKRAVIWRNGVITDLNTLIPQGSDWELVEATGIGFKDAVIGWGRRADGNIHGFMLTPPFDVELSLNRHQNEVSTNSPNPYEAGNLLLGVSVFNLGDFAPTGLTIRDTITGPIEYVSWDGGDCAVERTAGRQTLTCTVAPFEIFGRDIMIETRSTGAGPITHAAEILRSEHVDSNPSNNAASESNTSVALHSMTLAASTVTGGQSVVTRVTLTSPAPSGGARVTLTSSNPALATVPSEFDVLPGANGGLYRETRITTRPVNARTQVDISASYGMKTITLPLILMPAGSSWPFGDAPRTIPGVIQAEDFDEGGEGAGYHDTSRGNDGGRYRSTDVDIETTTDAGGGFNVGWMSVGEWLGYAVTVQTAGGYRLDLRVAANGPGGRLHVEFDGVNKTGTMTIPNTGGWQSWTTISVPVTLAAGAQRMRVVVDGAGTTGVVGNLNDIRLTATGPATTPFTGSPIAIPGIVQAENFDNGGQGVAYHDTTAGNSGTVYRTTDVDVQATTDDGGGYNVGWMAPAEWLTYSINVAATASYRLDLRIAADGEGGRVHIEFDGVDKTGPLTIPNTNGWQSWFTVHTTVSLTAGPQKMRLVVDAAGPTGVVGNVNFVHIMNLAAPAPPDIVIYADDVLDANRHGSWSKEFDSQSPGGVKLQTTDIGVNHATSPLASPVDYFDVTFQPWADQTYAVWLRLKALGNNKFNDAVWVQFSGAQVNGSPIYRIGSTSGLLVNLATDATASSLSNWGWQNGAYWLVQANELTFPAGGTQTLRVQVREDGVQVDQIVLSPSAYRHGGSPGAVSNDTVIVARRP